jgi:hypothetical protein
MQKFDLYDFFWKTLTEGQEDENSKENSVQNLSGQSSVPNMGTQQNTSDIKQATKNDKSEMMNQKKIASDAFSSFVGSTISGMNFKKNGATGGEIQISISNSNRPVKISWVGDKVTVTQPNGNIVIL